MKNEDMKKTAITFRFHLQSAVCLLLMLPAMMACTVSVPESATEAHRRARVLPDNADAVLPPNIAPLNFLIEEEGDRFVTCFSTRRGEQLVVSGKTLDIDIDDWHTLLAAAVGDTLWTDIYMSQDGRWTHFDRMANAVVADSIDPYITYRLIRPSYVTYEELTLNERSMSDFSERILYSNMILSDGDNGQCINCHVPQRQGQSGRSLFHVRQAFGGTVFIGDGHARKVSLKTDSTLSAGVYPAWHPTENLVVFSVNETGQVFHTLDPQKIEVIDYASDLIVYHPSTDEVRSLGHTPSDYESFPTWSPDGHTLYYISAHHVQQGDDIDADLDANYQQLHYNIYSRSYDAATGLFGRARLVFNADSLGKSASTPRVSPDGRWLLFSLADYGQFHIWHHSADLWALDLTTGQAQPLTDANSDACESYHSWSSNGRWMLYSSRRTDGNYTRLYLSYFDADGHAHRPLLLPQRRPQFYGQFFRSYNAAEWMTHSLDVSMRTLEHVVSGSPAPVTYGGSALQQSEAESAAIPHRTSNQSKHNVYENF